MTKPTFTCDHCGGTFPYEPGWSDEDALKESEQTFGFRPPADQTAVLCDDCWKEFLPWAASEGLTFNPN